MKNNVNIKGLALYFILIGIFVGIFGTVIGYKVYINKLNYLLLQTAAKESEIVVKYIIYDDKAREYFYKKAKETNLSDDKKAIELAKRIDMLNNNKTKMIKYINELSNDINKCKEEFDSLGQFDSCVYIQIISVKNLVKTYDELEPIP